MLNRNQEVRFFSKVVKTDFCWNWIGTLNADGYGRFRVRSYTEPNKSILANRASWFIHYGEIPEGLLVCHKCDNPSCVNPDHLFLGTNRDNVDDMVNKGRSPKTFKNPEIHKIVINSSKTNEAITKRKISFSSIEHQKGYKNSQFGTIWITNGYKNMKMMASDVIPEGWHKGRNI